MNLRKNVQNMIRIRPLHVIAIVLSMYACGNGSNNEPLAKATDVDAPTVINTVPAESASNVPVPGMIEVTFSEAMNVSSVKLNFSVVDITNGQIQVNGEFKYITATNSAQFFPVGVLFQQGVLYRVEIITDTIKNSGAMDIAGNLLVENLPGVYAWTFTTEPPTVLPDIIQSVTPVGGTPNIDPRVPDIKVNFSRALNNPDLGTPDWFTLETLTGTNIPGIAEYINIQDSWHAKFTADGPLSLITNYTVKININDFDNTSIVKQSWNFTTRDGSWDRANATQLDSFDASEVNTPQVAVDDEGNAIVILDQGRLASSGVIWANLYVAGEGWDVRNGGIALELDQGVTASIGYDLAMNSSGQSAVVWDQKTADIWVSLISPKSSFAPSPTNLSNNPVLDPNLGKSNGSQSANAAVDSLGNVTVVWRQNDLNTSNQSNWHINAKRYTVANGWETGATVISSGLAGSPHVVVDSTGIVLAIWRQRLSITGSYSIRANKLIPGQNPSWSSASAINLSASAPIDATISNHQISISANGDAFAVWRQYNPATLLYSVEAIRYDVSTGEWEKDSVTGLPISTTLASSDVKPLTPKVASDSSGNAIVVWQEVGIMTIRYDSGGGGWDLNNTTIQPEPTKIGDSGLFPDIYIEISMDFQGNAIVVWDNTGIWQNRYIVGRGWQMNGTAPNPNLINADNLAFVEKPNIALNKTGQGIAVWKFYLDLVLGNFIGVNYFE